jgi:hypothetical protein
MTATHIAALLTVNLGNSKTPSSRANNNRPPAVKRPLWRLHPPPAENA